MKTIKGDLKKSLLVTLTTLALTVTVFFGEIHEGTARFKDDAIDKANRAAREAARDKKTCWEPAVASKCKKDDDGYWTCYASSANHQGSCGGSDKRKPQPHFKMSENLNKEEKTK